MMVIRIPFLLRLRFRVSCRPSSPPPVVILAPWLKWARARVSRSGDGSSGQASALGGVRAVAVAGPQGVAGGAAYLESAIAGKQENYCK